MQVFNGNSVLMQVKLQNKLLAEKKPLPQVPNVPEYWGTMPHPLEWKVDQHYSMGKMIELSKEVSAVGTEDLDCVQQQSCKHVHSPCKHAYICCNSCGAIDIVALCCIFLMQISASQ